MQVCTYSLTCHSYWQAAGAPGTPQYVAVDAIVRSSTDSLQRLDKQITAIESRSGPLESNERGHIEQPETPAVRKLGAAKIKIFLSAAATAIESTAARSPRRPCASRSCRR